MRVAQFLFLGLALGAPQIAVAQNVSGVPSPVIKSGERAFEYRAAYGARDDGAADIFAQRFHFQQAIADDWRIRVLLVQEKRGGEDLKLQSASMQVAHFIGATRDWKTGFRADGEIPLVDGRPGRARLAWLNEFALADDIYLRGDLFIARQFGDAARDGVFIETRAEFGHVASKTLTFGAQVFNQWGATSGFGPWSAQRHEAGPFVRARVTKHARVEVSALAGLSAAAPDADFRVFLGYDF